ncbi:ATP-binding cassette domain-containing protein [Shimia sediminis]|uniref:ATP-binding cassette domain-containing protein n=1 Tax=Shimia sediminis TaxID=2497945 RepID=UPI0013E0E473|nr:ATP-binding cassette domain-containing protein [Shimia sediminis]
MQNSKIIASPDEAGFRNLIDRRLTVIRYQLVASGVIRDPIVILTVLSSLSRSLLMFSVNETARTADDGMGWSVVVLVVSALAMLSISHMNRVRAHRLIIKLKEDLRLRLTRSLLRANIEFLLSGKHGQVYSAITGEVDEVSGAIINLIEAAEAVLIVSIAVPYLFWISPYAGFATLVAICVGVFGYFVFDQPARRQMVLSSRMRAEFCDRVRDMLAGWKEVRLRDTRRQDLEDETRRVIEEFGASANRTQQLYSLSTTFGQASTILLLCFVVIIVPLMSGGGTEVMFQILTVVFLASGPIEHLFSAMTRMSRAENSYYRIQIVEAELNAAQSPALKGEIVPREQFANIELRDAVAHVSEAGREADEAFVLGPINLSFEPGETVFICGGNGSGKTTLLSLLTGLRNPDSGQILLDGEALTAETRASFRELFSGVFSGYHLFDRTFGLTDEEVALLQERIAELKLSDRVSVHEDRFSTLSLSAGQSRRLALAVALAENRPIIVLDEFAADQDPANRAFFYDVLVPELAAGGQLVIAVTHDDHQFGKCDRLIKMEGGRIVSDERQVREVAGAAQ